MQGHVPPGGSRGGGRAPLRGRPAARPAPRLPSEFLDAIPPRPWPRSPASATTSTSPRSHPLRRCWISARARDGRSAPPSGRRLRARDRSRLHRRPDRQGARLGIATDSPRSSSSKRASTTSPSRTRAFDVVISNGVINLSRSSTGLRRGGARPSAWRTPRDRRHRQRPPLKERTRRNVELWAACIAGAIPAALPRRRSKPPASGSETRTNDYDFISERALDACSTYGVESISLAALTAA